MRAAAALIVVTTCLLCHGGAAQAQAEGARSGGAERHWAEADRLFKAGRFVEAAASLRAADEASPDPLAQFNIGRCFEEAAKPEEALDAYQEYLKRGDDPDRRRRAEQKLAELEAQILGGLAVACTPEGSTVDVRGPSGELLGSCPWAEESLRRGTYDLRVSAEGYQPCRVKVEVKAGETHRETVSLKLAQGTLVVLAASDNATVEVDGRVVGTTPRVEIQLDPGEYSVEVDFPERGRWEADVQIEVDETSEVTAEAPGAVGVATPQRRGAGRPRRDASEGRSGRVHISRSGWAALAAAGGGLVAAAAGAGLAKVGHDAAQDASSAEGVDTGNRQVRWGQWLQIGGIGAAAVGGGLAAWLWWERRAEASTAASLRVSPTPTGVAISGRF